MPYAYVYQCDRCEWDTEVVLAEEFRLESDGKRVRYDYPVEGLIDWPPKRVTGLRSFLWCPNCRAIRERVLVQLDAPAEHPVQAFLAAEAGSLTGAESGPCPACAQPLRADPEGELCPGCDEGHLRNLGEYEP